jgi:uncharacterized iron-regulated membrane protein
VGGWLQDASGGSFMSAAVVLAIALLVGGLIMITLRRHADKPTVTRPAAPARDATRRASADPVRSRQRPRPAHDS